MNYYKKLKAKYYKMFPEDLKLEFGCSIEAYSVGMWGHKASLYFFKIISEKKLDNGDCMDKVFLLRETGFQAEGSGWLPKNGYPKTIEITQTWDDFKKKIHPKITKGDYHQDYKILGKDIGIRHVLRMLGKINLDADQYYDVTYGETMDISLETRYEHGQGKLISQTDLSKPLKDQTDKVLKSLWEVVK